jgi:hypothetical protein
MTSCFEAAEVSWIRGRKMSSSKKRRRRQGTNLGVESASVVPLQLVGRELGSDGGVAVLMNGDDVLSELEVDVGVALVEDDEEKIETGHDGRRHGDVGTKRHLLVVTTADGVGGGEDGRAGVESGLNTGLGDGDGLLLHRFVNRNLVGNVHLVELVDGADTVVGQHEGTGFDCELASLLVLDDGGGKTGGGGSLSGGVDGARKETANVSVQRRVSESERRRRGGNVLEELRLRDGRVSDDADVEITTKVHSLGSLLVHAAHELEENTLFDDLVAVNRRRNTRDEARVDVVAPDHRFELLNLLASQALEKLLAVLLSSCIIGTDVGSGRLRRERQLAKKDGKRRGRKGGKRTRTSALVAIHAKNAVLYVKSFTPRLFSPVTPKFPPIAPGPPLPPLPSLIISAFTPGNPSAATSGTTMKVPVKITLSPAFARSTTSARRITSRLRGIEPVGISFEFSWIRTFCQSENLDCSMLSFQAVRFEQVVFGQMEGCEKRTV